LSAKSASNANKLTDMIGDSQAEGITDRVQAKQVG